MRVIDTSDVKDVSAIAFAPDAAALAAGAHGRGVFVCTLAADGPVVRIGPDGFRWRTVLGYDPDGALVTVTTDGRTRFDPRTGVRLGVGPHDPEGPRPVLTFATSGNGRRLVTTQYWYPHSRLAGWESADSGWRRMWYVPDPGTLTDPAVTADGVRVAYLGLRGLGYELVLLDMKSGERVGTGRYPYGQLHGPRFRPDGIQIVVPCDRSLVVWDTRMLAQPAVIPNDSRRHFTAAAYHPTGRYLFTTSNDGTVTVWDTDTWARVRRFDWEIGRLRAVAVSPDGLLAAAGSDRGRVVVWDVDV